MTTDEVLIRGIRAAMQLMKERQLRHEEEAEEIGYDDPVGQRRLGLGHGYGESIGILEEMTGVSAAGLRIPAPRAESGTVWAGDVIDDVLKDALHGPGA